MRIFIFIFSIIALIFFSCGNNSAEYDPLNTFDASQRDSLLTDLITYIYVKPSGADQQTKFSSEFRQRYVEQLPKFKWLRHHLEESGEHYFYLIRPARNVHGHKRGVCGKFRLDEAGKIIDFEELFNTPMIPEEEAVKKGEEMFAWLVKKGDFKKYYLNKEYIEFPDERSFYDKKLLEWSYKKQ